MDVETAPDPQAANNDALSARAERVPRIDRSSLKQAAEGALAVLEHHEAELAALPPFRALRLRVGDTRRCSTAQMLRMQVQRRVRLLRQLLAMLDNHEDPDPVAAWLETFTLRLFADPATGALAELLCEVAAVGDALDATKVLAGPFGDPWICIALHTALNAERLRLSRLAPRRTDEVRSLLRALVHSPMAPPGRRLASPVPVAGGAIV
jgi:hypothetical protein